MKYTFTQIITHTNTTIQKVQKKQKLKSQKIYKNTTVTEKNVLEERTWGEGRRGVMEDTRVTAPLPGLAILTSLHYECIYNTQSCHIDIAHIMNIQYTIYDTIYFPILPY